MAYGNASDPFLKLERRLDEHEVEILAWADWRKKLDREIRMLANQVATLTQQIGTFKDRAVSEAVRATQAAWDENSKVQRIEELKTQIAARDQLISQAEAKRGKWADRGWDVVKVLVGIIAAWAAQKVFHV